MDSGLFAKVLTSPEVLVVSLALIFLLPLVFFIASTRSRRRFVRVSPRAAGGARTAGASASARRADRPGRSEPPARPGAEDDVDELPETLRRPAHPPRGEILARTDGGSSWRR